jgi:hypothetical protein
MVQVAEKRGAGSVVCRLFFVVEQTVFAVPALHVLEYAGRHGNSGTAIGLGFPSKDVDGADGDGHRISGREYCVDLSRAHSQEFGARHFGQLACQPGRSTETVADRL